MDGPLRALRLQIFQLFHSGFLYPYLHHFSIHVLSYTIYQNKAFNNKCYYVTSELQGSNCNFSRNDLGAPPHLFFHALSISVHNKVPTAIFIWFLREQQGSFGKKYQKLRLTKTYIVIGQRKNSFQSRVCRYLH